MYHSNRMNLETVDGAVDYSHRGHYADQANTICMAR